MEIKETVLSSLNNKQALADLQKDARFQLTRSLVEYLPARAWAEASQGHHLETLAKEVGKTKEVLRLAFILVFQDGFLRGLQLDKVAESPQNHQPELSIATYYKALKVFPDLEETIAEVTRKKIKEVEPRLEEAVSLPDYMDLDERKLVLDTLARRECNRLLDFAIFAGKVCSKKARESELKLL